VKFLCDWSNLNNSIDNGWVDDLFLVLCGKLIHENEKFTLVPSDY